MTRTLRLLRPKAYAKTGKWSFLDSPPLKEILDPLFNREVDEKIVAEKIWAAKHALLNQRKEYGITLQVLWGNKYTLRTYPFHWTEAQLKAWEAHPLLELRRLALLEKMELLRHPELYIKKYEEYEPAIENP